MHTYLAKKIISHSLALVIGLSAGLAAGLLFCREQQKTPSKSSDYVVKKAHPATVGAEVVNNEIIGLLTDMYAGSDYVHMQIRVENTVYPYRNVDKETLGRLISLFNEYEWRANRALSSFEASDFELFVEIYTPGMAQVLTLYGGYDLAFFAGKSNDAAAFYTYLFAEDGIHADLAVRLAALQP